jgi:hypothetical protein
VLNMANLLLGYPPTDSRPGGHRARGFLSGDKRPPRDPASLASGNPALCPNGVVPGTVAHDERDLVRRVAENGDVDGNRDATAAVRTESERENPAYRIGNPKNWSVGRRPLACRCGVL